MRLKHIRKIQKRLKAGTIPEGRRTVLLNLLDQLVRLDEMVTREIEEAEKSFGVILK